MSGGSSIPRILKDLDTMKHSLISLYDTYLTCDVKMKLLNVFDSTR